MTTWWLGRRPALDGLRGIAVLLVVAYHGLVLVGVVDFLPSMGTVGVSMFFTLSGFLITSLLLDELERTGRLGFGAFYLRRARRLLPALFALIGVCALLTIAYPGLLTLGSALSSMFYVENWWIIADPATHRDIIGHTWSLAIEEQFYLVWPAVLVGLMRWKGRRAVMVAALSGAVLSIVLREAYWLSGSESLRGRIGFATETRADAVLIGCALAVLMRGVLVERARPGMVAAGMALVAVASGMFVWAHQVVAPLLAAVGAGMVIYGSAQGGGVVALEWRWLRWFGRRSYGLYLWHMVPYALLVIWGLPVLPTLAIFAASSLALTVLSWRLVELPFLRSGHASHAAEELERGDVRRAAARVA